MRRLESDSPCYVFRTHLFLGKPDTEENRAAFVSTVPLGRPSTPRDVANTCCFLASDEAEFITGVNLEVGTDLICSISALTNGYWDSGGRWTLCLDNIYDVAIYRAYVEGIECSTGQLAIWCIYLSKKKKKKSKIYHFTNRNRSHSIFSDGIVEFSIIFRLCFHIELHI